MTEDAHDHDVIEDPVEETNADPAPAPEPEAPSLESQAGRDEDIAPPAPAPSAPASIDLGGAIEAAMSKAAREDEHRKEHERLAAATAPAPAKPKGFLDRLRWGG